MEIAGSLHCSVVVITRCDLVLKCRDVIILSGIILKLSRAKKHTEAEACGRIRPNARRLRKKRLRKENISFQQYNCNQERIENNQLIGFANARPSTGILGLPYCNFCAVQTIPKTISTQCHFVVNVKSVSTPKFNHEQNLYKFC